MSTLDLFECKLTEFCINSQAHADKLRNEIKPESHSSSEIMLTIIN